MGITFATYNRKNTAKYFFYLYKNGKEIYKKVVDSSKLKDCKTVYFSLDEISIKSNDKYEYKLEPIDSTKGNAITVPYDETNNTYYYEIRGKSEFNTFIVVVFIILLILFFLFNYLINYKIKSYNKIFLLFLIYMLFLLFLYPPLQMPDERYHFSNVYSISQYDFNKSPYENINKKIKVSNNFYCLRYADTNGEFTIENVNNKEKLKNCFNEEKIVSKKNLEKIDYGKLAVYIVPAIGIKIGSIFTSSPMILYYIGRIFNFLLSYLIIFYAFKIIPKYKNLLLAIVMIPTFLQQMVSYSYDSLFNALCILVVCMLVKFKNSDRISIKDLLIYSLSSIFIFYIKAPYILIPLLIVLLDCKKFNGKRNKYLFIVFLILISLFSSKFLNRIPTIGKQAEKGINVIKESNFDYLIKNPLIILSIAKNTIIMRGKWYIITMIGSIGKLSYQLNDFVIISYMCTLILMILTNENNSKKIKRLIGLVVLLILLSGIFLSMYLGWSSYQLSYVEGVQGRYFFPLLFPLGIILMPKKKKIEISDSFIFTFINLISFYYIIYMMICFY